MSNFNSKHFSASTHLPCIENVALSRYSTFQLGGLCPAVILCQNAQELRTVVENFYGQKINEFLVIGEDSNILFSDAGLTFPVIRYYAQDFSFAVHDDVVMAEACAPLDALALFCAQRGLEGLGFASGIPGTIAGACAGNAGAFGCQISDVLSCLHVIGRDGTSQVMSVVDGGFGYRFSRFQNNNKIITRVEFKLRQNDAAQLMREREEILDQRRKKHPDYRKIPCAGSFFKNIAPKTPGAQRQAAGLLLDQAGAKAMTMGGAGVFDRHANIIIKAREDCKAKDVYALSEKMRETVYQKFGISLEREVQLIGEF